MCERPEGQLCAREGEGAMEREGERVQRLTDCVISCVCVGGEGKDHRGCAR